MKEKTLLWLILLLLLVMGAAAYKAYVDMQNQVSTIQKNIDDDLCSVKKIFNVPC